MITIYTTFSYCLVELYPATAPTTKAIANKIQRGDSTHHQLQAIVPINL